MPRISSLSKYCFRTSGATVPVLGLAQSFWALTHRELSIADALEIACAEGFEYFEVGLRDERITETEALLKRFPVKLIAQGWATSAGEATTFIERAVELNAVALNMHLGHAYMTMNEAVDLVGEVQRQAISCGMPLLIETHRGRLTQDLFRTSELLKQIPETVITLDLSHYIVAGETLGGVESMFRAHLDPLLSRTGLIHGRISNGQSIQVPANDSFAFTSVTQSIWQKAMSVWLKDAPGDAVFLFEPELGPPPYIYRNSHGAETFNRTVETRFLVQVARECWKRAEADLRSHIAITADSLDRLGA